MRKHYRLLTMLGLLLGWLTACAAPVTQNRAATDTNTEATTKPRLVIAIPTTPEILDAQQAYDGDWATMEQIGQALVHIDSATGKLIPDLAKTWTFSEDGKQLTITLPEGATYSNGNSPDAQQLEEVLVRFIPEEATLANELEAGSVDVVVGLTASAVERLRSNAELQITESTLAGYVGLVTNLQRKPFNDLAVRQAIAQALDRDAIVKVLGAAAAPQSAFINQAMIGYSAEIAAYAQKLHPYDKGRPYLQAAP